MEFRTIQKLQQMKLPILRPMKLINLTPHFINLYQGEECVLSIPSRGVLRAKEEINSTIDVEFEGVKTTIVNKVLNYPCTDTETFDDPVRFRQYLSELCGESFEKWEGKFVVSFMTLAAITDYYPSLDYWFITTDNLVRDESGKIIGCRGFAQ